MEKDPNKLYELIGEPPSLGRPVLVQVLTGLVDAGEAVRLVREHIMSTFEPTLVARFDVDELLDYRSRRPMMTFVEDRWDSYDEPVLGLYRVNDDAGTPFLLLAGPEPDLRWERFVEAVIGLVRQFGVRLTVSMAAIPMAVPHTRPLGVTAHATRSTLITGHEPWLFRAQVPASVGNLLEYRLGQKDHDAVGFAVHVPHYLSQTAFPSAAEALLTRLSRVSGLLLPTGELHSAAETIRGEIDRQVSAADEAGDLVRRLEEQYDVQVRSREHKQLLGAETAPLPTADELGAEFERFLAEHNPPTEPFST